MNLKFSQYFINNFQFKFWPILNAKQLLAYLEWLPNCQLMKNINRLQRKSSNRRRSSIKSSHKVLRMKEQKTAIIDWRTYQKYWQYQITLKEVMVFYGAQSHRHIPSFRYISPSLRNFQIIYMIAYFLEISIHIDQKILV